MEEGEREVRRLCCVTGNKHFLYCRDRLCRVRLETFSHLSKLTINQKGHSHLCPFFLCYCCVKPSDTARRVPTKYTALKTFHWNVFKIMALQAGHRAERSCSLRPRKAVAFLTHLRPVPRSMGTGSFAVCGRRLRGHVPSKNTSPTVLSWISLMR